MRGLRVLCCEVRLICCELRVQQLLGGVSASAGRWQGLKVLRSACEVARFSSAARFLGGGEVSKCCEVLRVGELASSGCSD